jgi:hypothetical protein
MRRKYYIPKTQWFHYDDMSLPRIQRAVEMVGGRDIKIETEYRNTNSCRLVTFRCDESRVENMRKALSKILDGNQVSIYERKDN